MSKAAAQVWRVEWIEGFGWPDCIYRRTRVSHPTSEHTLNRILRNIQARPTHHTLVSVKHTETRWQHYCALPPAPEQEAPDGTEHPEHPYRY